MREIKSFQGEYYFLSNFYPCFITHNGLPFRSSEAAYQASKVGDSIEAMRAFTDLSARDAKELGQKVQLRSDWELVKVPIMYLVLISKFTRDMNLRSKLKQTGDATLIEGNNWHDNYWGNCICPKCKNIDGQNMLGKMLMKVRSKI